MIYALGLQNNAPNARTHTHSVKVGVFGLRTASTKQCIRIHAYLIAHARTHTHTHTTQGVRVFMDYTLCLQNKTKKIYQLITKTEQVTLFHHVTGTYTHVHAHALPHMYTNTHTHTKTPTHNHTHTHKLTHPEPPQKSNSGFIQVTPQTYPHTRTPPKTSTSEWISSQ